MNNRIMELTDLIEYLITSKSSTKDKAATVKTCVKNGLITLDEGIELIVRFS